MIIQNILRILTTVNSLYSCVCVCVCVCECRWWWDGSVKTRLMAMISNLDRWKSIIISSAAASLVQKEKHLRYFFISIFLNWLYTWIMIVKWQAYIWFILQFVQRLCVLVVDIRSIFKAGLTVSWLILFVIRTIKLFVFTL